jgi:hypothetical protein
VGLLTNDSSCCNNEEPSLQETAQQVTAFAGDVIGRLCRRGHVGLVASKLWQLLGSCEHQGEYLPVHDAAAQCGSAAFESSTLPGARSKVTHVAQDLLLSVRDRSAMEKLLEALLRNLNSPRCGLVVAMPSQQLLPLTNVQFISKVWSDLSYSYAVSTSMRSY